MTSQVMNHWLSYKLGTTTAGATHTSQPHAMRRQQAYCYLTTQDLQPTAQLHSTLAIKLLLNADGTAGFSIPDGETFAVARINSTTGAVAVGVQPMTSLVSRSTQQNQEFLQVVLIMSNSIRSQKKDI